MLKEIEKTLQKENIWKDNILLKKTIKKKKYLKIF